jgi:hypothetical protein
VAGGARPGAEPAARLDFDLRQGQRSYQNRCLLRFAGTPRCVGYKGSDRLQKRKLAAEDSFSVFFTRLAKTFLGKLKKTTHGIVYGLGVHFLGRRMVSFCRGSGAAAVRFLAPIINVALTQVASQKLAEMADGRPSGRPVTEPNGGQDGELWVRIVEGQVRALKFGSVQITVHEGRVVQVETNSKIRIDRP